MQLCLNLYPGVTYRYWKFVIDNVHNFSHLQINIGIVELEGGSLKVKRGSHLPVHVKKSDSHVTVKKIAVNKQLAHNKHLIRDDEDSEWTLLYPDMDNVRNLPGENEMFTVEKYKESLGRPYSRVNLYICKMLDFDSKI